MDKPVDYYKDQMRIYNSFPVRLESELADIIKLLTFKDHALSPDHFVVKIDGETIKIPARVYFDEPTTDKQNQLSPLQKEILSCIFTRHHDGFVREKHLKKIILSKNTWVIPYVFRLVGEYVIEILNVIYDNMKLLNISAYKVFINENPIFYQKTKQRVRSYWDCYYYSSTLKINDYVGQKIIKFFEEN